MKNNYLRTVYNEENRPYTDYPEQLCHYLFQMFEMKEGIKFLEVGCGRGEFLEGFRKLGLNTYGADLCDEAKDFQPHIPISICDIEKEPLALESNFFDIIFSKSFIEHLFYPDKYFTEAYRLLKPGGKLITLVPDWESNYRTFYDGYTHRTPFTTVSLADVYGMTLFESVNTFRFRQLPIVWRYPFLNYVCSAIAPFVPVRTKAKFFRWSRELMIIGVGTKPR